MDLYLLRHAIAETLEDAGVELDADRPLSPDGKHKMVKIAGTFSTLGVQVDRVLTSPFKRARDTAEIAAKALKTECEILPALAAGKPTMKVIAELATRQAKNDAIMIVGHEPDFSRLISMLLSGSADLQITMKKAGLCKLRVERFTPGNFATLEWLLTPKQMLAIAS
ncbi:MAG: phosphohistidine phosphatase SixA [Verrucomicrobiota bacterium]|nr:phosphohistidine phosphatase SixA [Verrucomicrobiota bacterium]